MRCKVSVADASPRTSVVLLPGYRLFRIPTDERSALSPVTQVVPERVANIQAIAIRE